MHCAYCQNFEISTQWKTELSKTVSIERLAGIMCELQAEGAHSISLVSPTHFVPQIVQALLLAVPRGLTVPLIYNTNAYDAVDVLRLLEGVIDIYLPDMKYADDDLGLRYSKVGGYAAAARAAVTEMHRQMGSNLAIDENGLVQRGLIIRHLVLPNDIASSKETLKWISETLDDRVTLSIMSQYYPVHEAVRTELLDRGIRPREYERVLDLLSEYGFDNGWAQEFASSGFYRPDFSNRSVPFADAPAQAYLASSFNENGGNNDKTDGATDL
jgi:putative pyruvate formate lyase activating enzyme